MLTAPFTIFPMTFKEATAKIPGLRFISDKMEILSGPGADILMGMRFDTNEELLRKEWDTVEKGLECISKNEFKATFESVRLLLMQTRNISGTLARLASGEIPDDIDLFEIKGLALVCCQMAPLLDQLPLRNVEALALRNVDNVVATLDPENTRSVNFYIYDSYSLELKEKRKLLRALQQKNGYDEEESQELISQCFKLEDKVRRELAATLKPYAGSLKSNLDAIGRIDVILAKAKLAVDLDMRKPELTERNAEYVNLRYAPVESRLREEGAAFQPVSIRLQPGVTLVTGTNMGGKSITLKSLALAQALAQFGFYVTASEAKIHPVAEICLCLDDNQSEKSGLSSFGAEILRLDEIIRTALKGTEILVLIDEPARTTNPDEGRALVNALTQRLAMARAITVITTHYSGIGGQTCRYKVKGLKDFEETSGSLRPDMLQDLMDYSLVADTDPTVPREALKIASLLGVDSELIELAKKYLSHPIENLDTDTVV